MRIFKFMYQMWPGWVRSITARVPDPRIKAKCFYTMEQAIFSGMQIKTKTSCSKSFEKQLTKVPNFIRKKVIRVYRLIYLVIEDCIHIELLEVNKHDY